MASIGLEKACNKLPKEMLGKVLKEKIATMQCIKIIRDMHDAARTSAKSVREVTEDFTRRQCSSRIDIE